MHNQESPSTEEIRAPEMESNEVKKEETKLTDTQKESLVNFVEYLIDTLTLKRVFLIAIMGIFGLGLFTVFEHRGKIMQSILTPKHSISSQVDPSTWDLSEASKKSLKDLMAGTPIKYVGVSEVDLKRNARVLRYAEVDKTILTPQELTSLHNVIYRPHSVFDYDAKNTAQMVAVLANEFRCDNFSDTSLYKTNPELADRFITTCRLAIPPFVGQFVGFITVVLDRKVSKAELDSLRLEVSRVAVEIYLQDVTKQPKNV